MFQVDPATLAPEAAALLISRGQGVPPLVWSTRPNRIAARTLDDIQLPKLFDRPSVQNPQMASAVRALLYFWNGWPAEAIKETEHSPEHEKAYIAALCARQAGETVVAKEYLQSVGAYPIFHALGQHAVQGLMGCPDPLLVRFQQTIGLGEAWEPFLFVDLYDQACAGKLKDEVVQVVCTLQSLEFEYLFQHCYEAAIGERLVKKAPVETADKEVNRQRTRELAEKHRAKVQRQKQDREEKKAEEAAKANATQTPAQPAPQMASPQPAPMMHATPTPSVSSPPVVSGGFAPPAAAPAHSGATMPHTPSVQPVGPANAPASGPSFVVSCPKCRNSVQVAAGARGTRQACGHCGAAFLVPHSKAAAQKPLPANLTAPPPGKILLRCPKCADVVTLSESSRGKPERCPKCGAKFIVPRKKSTAAM